jgi:hypothetical protein
VVEPEHPPRLVEAFPRAGDIAKPAAGRDPRFGRRMPPSISRSVSISMWERISRAKSSSDRFQVDIQPEG